MADSITALLKSDPTEQQNVLTNLQRLDSTGLLKSIYVVDQGQIASLSISDASTLSLRLESIGLGNKILPMKVSAKGSDFGPATEPPVTKQRPYYFPNLGDLSALAGKGRLIMPPQIDLSDMNNNLVDQVDLKAQLVNLGLMQPG